MGTLCHIKYKSSPSHKTINNCIIFYPTMPMITSLKLLKNLENKQINF